MKLYISGISGTAMGALAIFAKQAGIMVTGSDLHAGAVAPELKKEKIEYMVGEQDGEYLKKKIEDGEVDWFVYTSALPKDHKELLAAKDAKITVSKRDELIKTLVSRLGLKMVAVAGTHGKTTTTSIIIWTLKKLGIKASHLVGSTLPFARAGEYVSGSKYLIYEADEYDRNFLHYHPWLSVITTVDYDHPDIYPTVEEYQEAFAQFVRQSKTVITGEKEDKNIKLAGKLRRIDANYAVEAVMRIIKNEKLGISRDEVVKIVNRFPGVGRRFEKLADGIYTDYAHHPNEIRATLQMAQEEAENLGKKGVVVVYEPHQNVRQHEILCDYKETFLNVSKLFWLPTYLVRENPELRVLCPEDFIKILKNPEIAESAKLDEKLEKEIKKYQKENYLVLLMTAGPADEWLRKIV